MPTYEEKIEIINCLKELDCCSRCILRYMGVAYPDTDAYVDPETYLNSILEDVKPDISAMLPPKKIRRNPCRLCLGIFENETLERFAECIPAIIKDYKCPDFTTNVSFPKTVIIRNHSILIYLKEKFPHIYENLNFEHLTKIFRMSSIDVIAQKINKHFARTSNLTLVFEIGYEDDEMEIRNIKRLKYAKKGNQQDMSKNLITAILEKCEDKVFKQQFPVPPEIPVIEPVANIRCMTEPLYLGGRYLKFSRNMGQTPWNNDDGQTVVQHCLQDIIFDSIKKILGYSKEQLTFSASGREDADVRMLGDGRPFYIQVENVKDTWISFDQLRAIEREVIKSKLAAVIKLQTVTKEKLKKVKHGEEHKNKHYNALCKTFAINIDDVIRQINNHVTPLEIDQQTPMRVLHRRTQAVRKKNIYSMNAKSVPGQPDLFELNMVTQAGTYVKEFVHGDFERTRPSISSLIGQPVDVVALDVTAVTLVWPEDDEPK